MVRADGKKVSALRKSKFLSRDELAERAGMTRSNLQRIEQSTDTGIGLKTLRKLAGGLGMAPEELIEKIRPIGSMVAIYVSDARYAKLMALVKTAKPPAKSPDEMVERYIDSLWKIKVIETEGPNQISRKPRAGGTARHK